MERVQVERRELTPDSAMWVGPGSYLANPFRAYEHCPGEDWGVDDTGRFMDHMGHGWTEKGARKHAVLLYRNALDDVYKPGTTARKILALNLHDKDLACRCSLDMPCHVDVLLEVGKEWTGE